MSGVKNETSFITRSLFEARAFRFFTDENVIIGVTDKNKSIAFGGVMKHTRDEKEQALIQYLKTLQSGILAFSGGVDSTYLLYVAHKVMGDRLLAVTMRLASVPEAEIEDAKKLAASIGARHTVIAMNQFDIDGFADNPENRCYLCKHFLFSRLKEKAAAQGYGCVMDGTNLDDTAAYRPGRQALSELGIQSPLCASGLSKADIRALSKKSGLPTWSKPSFPCMATRFPYHERITRDKLARVEAAENLLRQEGFTQFRVRSHGDLARIEVPAEDMQTLFDKKERLSQSLTALGFLYVSMDLFGFASGSMDKRIARE